MKTKWIDTDATMMNLPEGSPGFLILISPQEKADRYVLRDTPARGNMSGEAKLHGWCGETNNVSTYAEGVWQPIKQSLNQERTQIAEVTDPEEIAAFLEAVGWPELAVE